MQENQLIFSDCKISLTLATSSSVWGRRREVKMIVTFSLDLETLNLQA